MMGFVHFCFAIAGFSAIWLLVSYLKKQVIETEDGSPSLLFHSQEDQQLMHSYKGAFSETEYIYGMAIEEVKDLETLHILSVGLGFAYSELSAVCHLWEHKDYQITSYESEKDLVEALLAYLNQQPSIYQDQYEKIFSIYSEHFKIPLEKIRQRLKDLLASGRWKILGAFSFQTSPNPYNAILFDPFCARFHQQAWQMSQLLHWLENNAARICIFSTYAAKGELKRGLKNLGFRYEKRPGFAYKRESTFAIKGR